MAHLLHFVVGVALLLHVLFWGAGAALLAMPRPWRRFWPVLTVPAGLALQSAVVWAGAYGSLAGTDHYALAAEVVPLVLLALGLWRHGVRRAGVDVSRFGLVWLQVGGCLALLILPLAIASKGLTTISLSSCDAGDYAGGARTLMEFSRSDRSGFLGLSEVVRVASVDNFFDFWLRLNHFTPSALIALNGSILDCRPHELTSLVGMLLVAGSLPLVFWVARAILGYSGSVSLFVSLIYGLSPVTWYAAMQVALGQLLAAQGIALLTWVGVTLWRGRLSPRRALHFTAVLAIGYWIILGSYNFIVLVCLVPAIAYAGGLAIWRGRWARLGQWAGWMLLPLVICSLVFFERVAGLAERFSLLRTFDFGWHIPPLGPEGWLGMVSGPDMEAWSFFGLRWLLVALVGVPFFIAVWRGLDQRRSALWVVASIMVPVLIGYVYLEARGARLGTNASYDAYKLFAVFYPLFLAAACWWLTLRRSRRLTEWFGVIGLAGVIIAFNLLAAGMFVWRMARPPLMVDNDLRQLRRVEDMPNVTSVNVLLDHMWERLWANEFLLRKPQYFLTTSYEGRWATPLKGEWDLRGSLMSVESADPADAIAINQTYRAVRHQSNSLKADFGEGWHPIEILPQTRERWRWSATHGGDIVVENPRPDAVSIKLVLDARSYGARDIAVTLDHGPAVHGRVAVERGPVELTGIVVPPGRHQLHVDLGPTDVAAPADPRGLGICVWRVTIASAK